MLASVDGAIGPADQARIPVTEEGLLRGDGGFDALRLYGGRPCALAAHLARFERTCAGLRLTVEHEALHAEIQALLEAAGPVDGVLRFYATRGGRRIVLVEPIINNLARWGPGGAAAALTASSTEDVPPAWAGGLTLVAYAAAAAIAATTLTRRRDVP